MRGIITPLVTPLRGPDQLDEAGLERLIEHVIGAGIHGIFVLGTTGEGPNLSSRLRLQAIRRAASSIAQRVPLLAGVTGASFVDNLELACEAARAGAAAVAYAGPLYAPLGQAALADHIERFARQSPLPVMLYNMPSHTHLAFAVETVRRLAQCPNVTGLKDSSGDLGYFQQLRRVLPAEFSLFMGPEDLLLPALLAGASGGVNGGSNLFPRPFVRLYDAAQSGDWVQAGRLQREIIELGDCIYANGYLPGLKAALEIRGLCDGALAEPLVPAGEGERSRIAAALEPRAWN